MLRSVWRFREVLSNFAGGILILVLKPFTVGDYIIVTQENIEGTVKEIQIFYTKLATIDNQTVVVPNSILTNNSLTNVTARPERKLDLKVGISYEADLRKAKQIVEEKLRDDPSVIQDEENKSICRFAWRQRCRDRTSGVGQDG